jgi:hypothetical protein
MCCLCCLVFVLLFCQCCTPQASLAQLVEHALRKRMVMGSIPIGGSFAQHRRPPLHYRLCFVVCLRRCVCVSVYRCGCVSVCLFVCVCRCLCVCVCVGFFGFLSLGRLVYWYDSRFGSERSRVQFPERPCCTPRMLHCMRVGSLWVRRGPRPGEGVVIKTLCPSGLRGWTQVPLARAAWVQIPQVSLSCPVLCVVLGLGLAGGPCIWELCSQWHSQ